MTGSAVISSETLVANALSRRFSKPFIEPTKTIAAHDVEVVRQVEVGLLVAEDQVGLADDPDDAAVLVDDRDRPLVGLGEQLDRAAGVGVGGDGRHVGVHDLGGGLHRACRRGYSTRRARGEQPRPANRVDHVGRRSPTRRRRSGRRRRGRRGRGRGPPAQAAAKGSRPRASSAAIIPERTSPVPAVARPGADEGVDRDPLAVGDDRVVALEDDDAPARRAASRAAARRCAEISSEARPSSRPSSPACGVSTVGAGRGRRSAPSSPAKALSPSASSTSGASIARDAPRAPARPSRGRGRGRGRGRRRRRARRRAARPWPRRARGSRRRRAADRHHLRLARSKIGSRSAGTATVA